MKKLLKQLLAVTTAIMMAITLLPAMANAEENKYGAEDTFVMKSGKITVLKTTQDSKTPLQGAGFTVYTALTFKQENGKIAVKDNYTGTPTSEISDVNTADFKGIIGPFTSASTIPENYKAHVARKEVPTDEGGKAEFTDLEPGIYIVAETKVPTATADTTYYESAPFIVSLPSTSGKDGNNNDIGNPNEAGTKWIYDITATPKNNAAFGEKKITGVNSQPGKNPGTLDTTTNKKASANIGDTVSYEIKATSPTKESREFNVTDTIKGLEIKEPIKVKVNNEELPSSNNYILTINEDKKGFKVAFTQDWIKSNPNTEITISYDAVVTSDAKIGTDANTNEAIIDFGNGPKKTIDPAIVYTYGFTLTKQGEGENEKLEGVKFALLNKDKVQIEEKETDKDGLVTFDGLAAGTYYLKETKTVSGYTLLANPIEITISAPAADTPATFTYNYDGEDKKAISQEVNGNERFTFTVTNKKGFNLPSTGGMGTYIFTIGGLVVMAGAVLLLVSSKKKRA